MYKEEREIRPRCLITGKCIVTESQSTGNCFVVVYWFDSRGQEPLPMNLRSILLPCMHVYSYLWCVYLRVGLCRDGHFYPRCPSVSLSQLPEEKRWHYLQVRVTFVLVWKSISSESQHLSFMPRKRECRFPKGHALKNNTYSWAKTSADCAGKQLLFWDFFSRGTDSH